MSTTTQCPHCGTRFKASQSQLEAYHGMVRCGHCHSAFDAVANRVDEASHAQLSLPIMQQGPSLPAQPIRVSQVATPQRPLRATPAVDTGDYPELSEPRTWPWAVGTALVTALLVVQAAYFFRIEIAARAPGLKPALLAGCDILRCDIPLPQNADLLSIESSDLEADPAQPGVITLSFTIRNAAPYTQAYPNLELTLNDANDVPVGRRFFHPAEYLKTAEDAKAGLASERESAIRLTLDTTGINAVGYRLFLYY